MSRTHALSVALFLSVTLAACGGGGGGNSGGGGGGGTTPPTTPPTTPVNPCTTALLADTSGVSALRGDNPASADKKTIVDGNPRGRLPEAIALHNWAEQHRRNREIRADVEATS